MADKQLIEMDDGSATSMLNNTTMYVCEWKIIVKYPKIEIFPTNIFCMTTTAQ